MSIDEKMKLGTTMELQAVSTPGDNLRECQENEEELRESAEQDAPPMVVVQAVALRRYLEGMRAYQENGNCSLSHREHLRD
ncbi:hypothetical protein KY363_08380 [Candidatus Woesearchaeota archaeon]|nr:hypothetical protein [Candidatus Woesearchaeota archaeon]